MGTTAIVLLGNIEAHQVEITSAIINQALEFLPDAYVIDFYKDTKLSKILQSERFIIKLEQWKYDSWKKMYKHYKDVMSDFDNVIIMKVPINRGISIQTLDVNVLKDINRKIRQNEKYEMDKPLMVRFIERLVFVKAIRNKNVVHFVIDPDEVDFSKVWNFKSYKRYGALKWDGCEYGPIYEYVLYNTFVQDIPKYYDFYFGASTYDASRKYLYDAKEEVLKHLNKRRIGFVRNNPKTGSFFLFDMFNSKDVRINQSRYLYNLKLSRYTLINPCYKQSEFNIIRFMESVICDCVPLILKTNTDVRDMKFGLLQNLLLTFPDIYDIIIERNLIITIDMLHIRLTKYYEDSLNGSVAKAKCDVFAKPDIDICSIIKSTKSFMNITDRDYVQSFYDNLFSEVEDV